MSLRRLVPALLLAVACTSAPPPPIKTPPIPTAVAPASASATTVPSAEAPPAPAKSAEIPAAWPHKLDVKPVSAAHAMVDSDAPLATKVGVDVLARGGNAVDAAVAVAFALAVVYPEAGNIGGGGFAVARASDGSLHAIDFRETAPAKASHDMFLDAEKKPIALVDAQKKPMLDGRGKPLLASRAGALSAGVPGTVAGLFALHQKLGKMPWRDVLQPAIDLAEKGFAVDAAFRRGVADAAPILAQFPTSKKLLLPKGAAPELGATFKNPELAAALKRIADKGADGFYKGKTAELVAAQMKHDGGLVTKEDLAAYKPVWRAPLAFDYRGYRVVSMPPPSSGGVALAMIANILSGYSLKELGWHSPEHLHLLAESMRRAFADRNALLGDPDFVKVPLDKLADPAYGAERRKTIAARATPSSEVAAGLPIPDGEHTTHFAVVDDQGGAVALTTTINELCGAGVVVGGAGFLLNDEMDDFTGKPGAPNLFGLVQGEANAVAPGKRPLSSMTPTIVMQAGHPVLVLGVPGGARIITTVLQVIVNVIDYGMSLSEAIDAPRIHHQWLPDTLAGERFAFSADTAAALKQMGYALEELPDWGAENSVEAIGLAPAGPVRPGALAFPRSGRLYGVSDARGPAGSAAAP